MGSRSLVAHFGAIGIPAGRVALELQFQSAPGQGGRQGLEPTSAWLEIVKLEALAAKQVAADTHVEGIWSWGWPSFSVAGNDPDKPAAACVYLWARNPAFCDGPALAGSGFDASVTEGQVALPAGVRCTLGDARITKDEVARTAAITGDREAAASALLERSVLRAQEAIDPQTVLAAERWIVRDRFGGSVARYRAALAAAHVTLADARAILADRLARGRVEERFRPRAPSGEELTAFISTYASMNVRLVSVEPEAPWLGDALRGFAVQTIAPDQVFALGGRDPGRRSTPSTGALPCGRSGLRCRSSRYRRHVRATSRGACSDGSRRPPSTTGGCARRRALCSQSAVCARDDLPATGDVDLTAWLPFLGN